MDILTGKRTRKPEDHPFYEYLEVNILKAREMKESAGISELNSFDLISIHIL